MYLYECGKVMAWVWSCVLGYGLDGVIYGCDGVSTGAWWGGGMGVVGL